MADSVTIKEFLAVLGYRVDESAQRRFMDSITSMSNAVLGLGAGITAAAGAVTAAVANMASSGAQMSYFAQTLNETVNNVDAIVFAWQKLGVAPQQTMHALQNLANMMRTDPGLSQLWGNYAGPGSLTQQLEHFGERFARMTQGEQFVIRQQFEKVLGPDFFNAFLTRGTQVGGGVQEFNIVRRLFHFDPDYFAQQSVQFERAWQSFHLRLNDLMGHGAGPILERMTDALRGMTEWLDAHSDEIINDVDKIGTAIDGAFRDGVDLVRDLTGWFSRLPTASKEAAEAIAVLGLAFLKPGWARIASIAYAIETLLRDYEAFRRTGQSPLGIPWEEIGRQIDYLVKQLGALNEATGGLLSPLHAIEAYFAVKLIVAASSFFTTVKAGIVSTTAAIEGTFLASLGRVQGVFRLLSASPFMAALGTYLGFTVGHNPIASQEQENAILGGPASSRPGYRPAPPGARLGPTNPELQDKGGPSIWERLGHILSYLNPISVAEGAELPANIKNLTQQMAALNDTLSNANDNGVGGLGSWASGLGAGVVSRLFGGGGGASGGQDAVKGINSPEAIDAVKYFMAKGWTLPQAIGIVSNLMQESGLSATIVNSTGHAGVAQWDAQRQRTFRLLHGKSVTEASRHEQYDFVDEELRSSEAKAGFALGQAISPEQAAMAFDRLYERSEGTDIGRRIANAGALGRNPNLQNATYNGGSSITQTNNVTINTSNDPNEVGRAWDEYNRRHWADLQRNQQGAIQ
jgi:hypothetical protein